MAVVPGLDMPRRSVLASVGVTGTLGRRLLVFVLSLVSVPICPVKLQGCVRDGVDAFGADWCLLMFSSVGFTVDSDAKASKDVGILAPPPPSSNSSHLLRS
ncbi:hypothetical protein ElyMa_006790300 [Elysia marginata]|uniref:Uncharacterized protein n=1 Tax=Elysia marginata TaxID=1093978 RepID=A0AAV4J6K7_9GAST|nr:hypothetical protein ElyMa_006790300 [Elysia marginata]